MDNRPLSLSALLHPPCLSVCGPFPSLGVATREYFDAQRTYGRSLPVKYNNDDNLSTVVLGSLKNIYHHNLREMSRTPRDAPSRLCQVYFFVFVFR